MALLYRHIRLDTNQPFYIGVAKKKSRPFSKSYRNKFWHEIVAKTEYEVDILLDDLTWCEALEKEKEFISLYKRIEFGGVLCNMTDGGIGGLGVIATTEKRLKISAASKRNGISKETREKMAAKLRGRPQPEWQRKILSEAAKNRKIKFSNPILQYDLNGNFIKEFINISQCQKELNINNIPKVLSGERKSAGGFFFKRKPKINNK
jgi:hypothetical protein